MTPQNIRNAVKDAQQFIKAAKVVLSATVKHGDFEFIQAGKDSGAMRRESMDLTRALAEMRKP